MDSRAIFFGGEAFALTGRQACDYRYPGRLPWARSCCPFRAHCRLPWARRGCPSGHIGEGGAALSGRIGYFPGLGGAALSGCIGEGGAALSGRIGYFPGLGGAALSGCIGEGGAAISWRIGKGGAALSGRIGEGGARLLPLMTIPPWLLPCTAGESSGNLQTRRLCCALLSRCRRMACSAPSVCC